MSSTIKVRVDNISGTYAIVEFVPHEEYLKHLAEKYPCYVAYILKKLYRSKDA